jgi:hypothetical protein
MIMVTLLSCHDHLEYKLILSNNTANSVYAAIRPEIPRVIV